MVLHGVCNLCFFVLGRTIEPERTEYVLVVHRLPEFCVTLCQARGARQRGPATDHIIVSSRPGQ